eukprot:TRINITY_DN49119_c0_g1_i1.p1 TRINITY_DN49119_c0_g1~~TRINITY_DN49119_c0_g1_i1.p1  ORF type:complete len:502 (-),score=71.34 TRINITY_DN49119_c0_g1_i1:83-1588(-)
MSSSSLQKIKGISLDISENAEPKRGNAFKTAFRLLCDYPDLAKAILTAGLLVATLTAGTPLVLNELKSEVWGHRMSEYSSLVAMATGVVSVLFGGVMGRVGDKIDRRVAFAIVGLFNFAPWYFLLCVGANRIGLYGFCTMQIIGGITCMTPTGCPMIFAFAYDVMPADERELAFGIAYTGVFVCALLASLGGVVVARLRPGEPDIVLWYILCLSTAFFLILFTVRIRGKLYCNIFGRRDKGDAGASGKPASAGDGSDDADVSSSESEDDCEMSSASSDASGAWGGRKAPMCSFLAPLRMVFEHSSIRNACFASGLLCLPEVALADVSQQFMYAELDLIDGTDLRSKQQLVSSLFVYSGFLSVLPAFLIAGFLGKLVGPLRLVRCMVPFVAVLQVVPVLMVCLRKRWFAAIIGMCLQLSTVIFTPLQTVVSEITPQDRVGEALGAIGVSKQAASFLGNIVVFFVVPHVSSFWYFYPASAVVSLTALWFVCKIRMVYRDDAAK